MKIAVILASGVGKRMGAGKNKVFLKIGTKPLIFYTIQAFEKANCIDKIVITSKKEEIAMVQSLIKKSGFKKIIAVIEGGKERQDSGYNALAYLKENIKPKSQDIILFHNGANPFVSREEIDEVAKMAVKHGASVVGYPAKDTIKKVDSKNFVVETLNRTELWGMQTPQAIKFPLAMKAFQKAKDENFIGTDDVSLVERLGEKVMVVECSPFNFKITTPFDLEVAKLVLKKVGNCLR